MSESGDAIYAQNSQNQIDISGKVRFFSEKQSNFLDIQDTQNVILSDVSME